MKKVFEGLLLLVASSFAVLNFSAGIIGGIWLIFLGFWQLVLMGIVIGVVMPWVYSLVMLPQLAVIPLIIKFGEKNHNFLFSFSAYIASLYGNFILGMWVYWIFTIIIQIGLNPAPLWLWGYATLMGPIGYMASKEDRNSQGSILGALFCQLSYVMLTFCYYALGSQTLGYGLVWLLMFVFSGISVYFGYAQMMYEKRREKAVQSEGVAPVYLQEPPTSEHIKPLHHTHHQAEHNKAFFEAERGTEFCHNCGKTVLKSSNFCKHCGARLRPLLSEEQKRINQERSQKTAEAFVKNLNKNLEAGK